ncbi:protein MAIN-LIKE 2-like [Glycine soja]|uniref:protein MAIN-LIKE 2-like n=1 Tax=Glycine soja TaxID=3848 RepID=UPI0010401E00|nr:protein MAIN-LIKE 2-like [Glycine soja]
MTYTNWVIGRALGSCDASEALKQQRPTTSACRQREVAPIVEDVEHVDHATDEVHEEPIEVAVDDVVTDVEGFPSEPHDTSVLMDYVHHVVLIVWNGEERPKLKLSSHEREVEKFGKLVPQIERLMAATRLSHLIACSLDTGVFHSFEALHVDDVALLLVELLEVSSEEARAETVQCHGAYVRLSWLRDIYQSKFDATRWTVATRAYLLHLNGSYALRATALVHMYENLNDTSKSNAMQLVGYITLLQCWVYGHFPFVASSIATKDYDERKPCACRWKYGKQLHIRWCPSIIVHRPERVVRQFGYVQTIPSHSAAPCLCVEDIDDRWI